jgi:hypothetical protein
MSQPSGPVAARRLPEQASKALFYALSVVSPQFAAARLTLAYRHETLRPDCLAGAVACFVFG